MKGQIYNLSITTVMYLILGNYNLPQRIVTCIINLHAWIDSVSFQNKHCCIHKKVSRVHEICRDGTTFAGALASVLSYTDVQLEKELHDTELRPVRNNKSTNLLSCRIAAYFSTLHTVLLILWQWQVLHKVL